VPRARLQGLSKKTVSKRGRGGGKLKKPPSTHFLPMGSSYSSLPMADPPKSKLEMLQDEINKTNVLVERVRAMTAPPPSPSSSPPSPSKLLELTTANLRLTKELSRMTEEKDRWRMWCFSLMDTDATPPSSPPDPHWD
jgi:hypothetical protein